MRDKASGLDDREVEPSRAEKSISAEETYDNDLARRDEMERQLLRLAERTARRLRKAGLVAGTVQIKIRQANFRTFTRQQRLVPPANGTDQVFELARELLRAWLAGNADARIRLLGVAASNLSLARQQDLFSGPDTLPGSDIDDAVDEIRDRFGLSSVGRARTLERP
jgi:DNA polymerase-4